MDDACPAGTGGMAALIGMDREKTLKMLNAMEHLLIMLWTWLV